jgi:hypothetical protein
VVGRRQFRAQAFRHDWSDWPFQWLDGKSAEAAAELVMKPKARGV